MVLFHWKITSFIQLYLDIKSFNSSIVDIIILARSDIYAIMFYLLNENFLFTIFANEFNQQLMVCIYYTSRRVRSSASTKVNQPSQIYFDMSSTLKDSRMSQKSFLEVVNSEKQLFPLINSEGIIHGDVLELYHEVRTGYENILVDGNQSVEVQEVEKLLWNLHYIHIWEFCKRIGQLSSNTDNIKDTLHQNINSLSDFDHPLEGFKSFLREATEFYRNLIMKLRKSCELPEEVILDDKDGSSFSTEPTKLHKCQFTCHRLLVCLGDLARYIESLKKPDAREWSIAANYYLEATKTCPESGNPHNQLALLATYVGDAFLALYHFLRSLAVKEPFPDAWRNLVLLFEKNSSTQLQSLSSEVQIDFLSPSKRSSFLNTSPARNGKLAEENASESLWPSIIQTISFFIIRSSLEQFPSAFASTLSRLEALLAVDDAELTATMESYQLMDSSRSGPYRAIQLVSTFIFVVHSLIESPQIKDSTVSDEKMQCEYTPLALTAIFICMGRLTERCLNGSCVNCPLLPAVLVFVEWLVGALDAAEAHVADERVMSAMSYFFGALSDFLNRLDHSVSRIPPDNTAIWEDHELRGFNPLARVHEVLDFTIHQECRDNSNYTTRSQRIFRAATKIVDRSKSSWDWISYNKEERIFYAVKTTNCLVEGEAVAAASGSSLEGKEPCQQTNESMINEEKSSPLNIQLAAEEEEVILFKPISRRNSAPICISKPTNDPVCSEATEIQRTLLDECLRRATTFSAGQQLTELDSFSFCSTISNSGENRLFKPQEPLSKESLNHQSGPPSLSAWVLGRGSSNAAREKETKDFMEGKLCPIDETASTLFSDLYIDERKKSKVAHEHISTITHNSAPYVAPLPSAPFLPDDAAWLGMNSLISPQYKHTAGNEADGILGAAPMNGYTNRLANRMPIGVTSSASGLVDGYPPLIGMSSSEWLYHYRNSQNVESAANHISPGHYNPPVFGNFHANEVCRFDLCDQWGNHLVSSPMVYLGSPQLYPDSSLVYGADQEQMRDKFFTGYQRPFPYLCGVGMELRSEQPPLLQYLKEKEWQLQPELQLRGPTFIGN